MDQPIFLRMAGLVGNGGTFYITSRVAPISRSARIETHRPGNGLIRIDHQVYDDHNARHENKST